MSQHEVTSDPALRPKVAAAYLGIGRTTLYSLFARGELRAVRLSPRITAVRLSELNRWVAARADQATAAA